MDPVRLEALGRRLAERHASTTPPAPARSLLGYAESARTGDWSLRSALVRFAQPEPQRAADLLELVRRLDAVLQPVSRVLERHVVACDPSLGPTLDDVEAASVGPPATPVADVRVADLARVAEAVPGGVGPLVAGYSEVAPLDAEEGPSIALLGVALDFDRLADTLAAWADQGPADPPVDALDATVGRVRARLDELGVPVEEWTEPTRRGARRRS